MGKKNQRHTEEMWGGGREREKEEKIERKREFIFLAQDLPFRIRKRKIKLSYNFQSGKRSLKDGWILQCV